MVVLAGALTAGVYEFVYIGIIVGADKAINGGFKTPSTKHITPAPTPRRY